MSHVEHLIVDTAAFIVNNGLKNIGARLYTVAEVAEEIKSERARLHAQLLPNEIEVFAYRNRAVDITQKWGKLGEQRTKISTNFVAFSIVETAATRTGDVRALSKADKRLLALAVDIARECKKAPKLPPQITGHGVLPSTKVSVAPPLPRGKLPVGFVHAVDALTTNDREGDEEKEQVAEEAVTSKTNEQTAEELSRQLRPEKASNSEASEEEESADDDDEGWITPHNIDAIVGTAVDEETEEETINAQVAVCTADYAMQNVLLHMGIDVVSPTGKRVRQLRHYVMRCHTCFTVTRDTRKEFCTSCGYKSLDRVTALINPTDGSVQLCLSTRRLRNIRPPKNAREPLPPIGGKHGRLVQTSEDHKLPQHRASKKQMTRVDALNDDYVITHGAAPFKMHDVNSRSAMLGIHRNNQTRPQFKSIGKRRGGKRN